MESTFISGFKWPYFSGMWWEGIGGLTGWLDFLKVLCSWRPEADSSETRVWWNENNKGVAPLAWWEWNSPVVLTEWMYKVMDSHTCAAFNSPGNTPISWKIKIRGCWVLEDDVFQSPIFCQMTFPVPKVKEFAWTNPFLFAQNKCYWLQILIIEYGYLLTCALTLPSSLDSGRSLKKEQSG